MCIKVEVQLCQTNFGNHILPSTMASYNTQSKQPYIESIQGTVIPSNNKQNSEQKYKKRKRKEKDQFDGSDNILNQDHSFQQIKYTEKSSVFLRNTLT